MHGKVPVDGKSTKNFTYKFCSFCGKAHPLFSGHPETFHRVEGIGEGAPCKYFCNGGDCEREYNKALAEKLPKPKREVAWVYNI